MQLRRQLQRLGCSLAQRNHVHGPVARGGKIEERFGAALFAVWWPLRERGFELLARFCPLRESGERATSARAQLRNQFGTIAALRECDCSLQQQRFFSMRGDATRALGATS